MQLKLRLKSHVYDQLKELSSRQGRTIDELVNDLLEKELLAKEKELNSFCNFFSEKPEVAYDEDGLRLYNNDFVTVDLSEYKNSVDLIITSPPYNLAVNYGKYQDNLSYDNYLEFTERWLKKAFALLKEGGRLCLNVPLNNNVLLNEDENRLKPIYVNVIKIAMAVGFGYQSTIVWYKQNVSRRTAWGSWRSASAPCVIAPVEMIALLYKGRWKKKVKGESTITKEEFIKWTNGVWSFPGESRKRIGHPAPFPLELPRRCIRLFSYKGDVVLDPFAGSGTTLIAALLEERQGIGVEIDENYVNLAVKRISKVKQSLLNLK